MSPAYFFDSMDFLECATFMRGMRRKERFELEQTRLIMWAAIQPHCKHKYSPEDILPLAAEEESECESEKFDREELERVRERAKKFEE